MSTDSWLSGTIFFGATEGGTNMNQLQKMWECIKEHREEHVVSMRPAMKTCSCHWLTYIDTIVKHHLFKSVRASSPSALPSLLGAKLTAAEPDHALHQE